MRRRVLMTLSIIALLAVAYVGPVRGLIDARSEQARAAERLAHVESERRALERQVANLRQPGRLEQEARRLGLARPGETMIIVGR